MLHKIILPRVVPGCVSMTFSELTAITGGFHVGIPFSKNQKPGLVISPGGGWGGAGTNV
jgi:hypothetical protein